MCCIAELLVTEHNIKQLKKGLGIFVGLFSILPSLWQWLEHLIRDFDPARTWLSFAVFIITLVMQLLKLPTKAFIRLQEPPESIKGWVLVIIYALAYLFCLIGNFVFTLMILIREEVGKLPNEMHLIYTLYANTLCLLYFIGDVFSPVISKEEKGWYRKCLLGLLSFLISVAPAIYEPIEHFIRDFDSAYSKLSIALAVITFVAHIVKFPTKYLLNKRSNLGIFLREGLLLLTTSCIVIHFIIAINRLTKVSNKDEMHHYYILVYNVCCLLNLLWELLVIQEKTAKKKTGRGYHKTSQTEQTEQSQA